ncbi:MAG: hypothetical protein ABWY06_14055 [Pseudomonas sp.]|uniref:hypothetical protein n=1 Tax=Pseudomonas sp. TaxID=306 RepID=UPI003391F28A
MDTEIRRRLLIKAVQHYLLHAVSPVPQDPDLAGEAIFAALLEDWERMSRFAQGQLLYAVAILARHRGAEVRAQQATQRILERLQGNARRAR